VEILSSLIGIFYFYAARSVQQLYFLLSVETHICCFIIESHFVLLGRMPRRRISSIRHGRTSAMATANYSPAQIQHFKFFNILNIRLTVLLFYFALTLFFMSSQENSRTELMYLLPRAPTVLFLPSGIAW
jgi:hypothetical protein